MGDKEEDQLHKWLYDATHELAQVKEELAEAKKELHEKEQEELALIEPHLNYVAKMRRLEEELDTVKAQ